MKPAFDVLIAGAGRLASPLATQLLADGLQVAMIRRSSRPFPAGVTGIRTDLADAGPALPGAAALLCCLSPAAGDEAGYRDAYERAPMNLLQRLGGTPGQLLLVSSTRVYPEQQGNWVDAGSEVAAGDFRSRALLAGERCWLASGHPASVVRFSGLYDGDSRRLIERAVAATDSPDYGLQWSNRIHREDAVGVLRFLLRRALAGDALAPVWLASDEQPALQRDVENWIRSRMGLAILSAPDPDAPRSGKRCDSRLLREAGYVFRYPDYRAGYAACISAADQ